MKISKLSIMLVSSGCSWVLPLGGVNGAGGAGYGARGTGIAYQDQCLTP